MVTIDVEQLSQECNAWRETLRSYREEFVQLKMQLQKNAASQSHKEDLLQLEHLDNQLHIQLINIHDLKRLIKNHDKQLQLESQSANTHLSDEVLASHEAIHEDFEVLLARLKEVKEEYMLFEGKTV
jgi:hypothetical protein